MNPIDLDLPDDVIVKGCLYRTRDPVLLREDLLEIDLPSGLTIDVGWCPEGDPNGAYRIVLFRNYWRNQVVEPIVTADIDRAIQIIRNLCAVYATPQLFPSSSAEVCFISAKGTFRTGEVVWHTTFQAPRARNQIISVRPTSCQLPQREYALN